MSIIFNAVGAQDGRNRSGYGYYEEDKQEKPWNKIMLGKTKS